jgi:hypothetical protein
MGAEILLATTLLSAGMQYKQQRSTEKAAKKQAKNERRAADTLVSKEAKNERQAAMRIAKRRRIATGEPRQREDILTSVTGVPSGAPGAKTILGR